MPAQTPRAQPPGVFDLIALGEVMLRFDPGEGRMSRARQFSVWEGGGEYNVARALRRCFGLRAGIVTALVDNPIGRLVEDLILGGGVDASHIEWVPYDGVGRAARNGVYYLERGYGVRPGLGMMDRGHTAIAQMDPGAVDWDGLFQERRTGWLHTGGIMAGLSERATDTVRRAMEAAHRHGVGVSFDCNYRASLWQSRGGRAGAVAVNRSLMPLVQVLFGHEGDVAETLGAAAHGPVRHDAASFAAMAGRVVKAFPNLQVVASPARVPHTATRNDWTGFCFADGQVFSGASYSDLEILDRVGGGDAFAAGVLYGLLAGKGLQWAVDCGVAHGALAMTTPGDSSMATLPEVERLMAGGHAGTNR